MSASLAASAQKALRDAARISLDLYKVMVPVIIGVKILKELDLISYLAVPLGPLMELAGLPANMGLAYGGGLILMEVREGRVSRRDVFSSLSLMSLSHALIEDTLLMTLIGASMQGTFFGRLIFSMLVVAVLSRVAGPRLSAPGPVAGRTP
jgi:hypothetical protein